MYLFYRSEIVIAFRHLRIFKIKLYELVLEYMANRKSCDKLRKISGFDFQLKSDEFKNKLAKTHADFSFIGNREDSN